MEDVAAVKRDIPKILADFAVNQKLKKSETDLLLLIAAQGAAEKPVFMSGESLAKKLGVSQQTASRWLASLHEEGLVQRNGRGVALTQKAEKRLEETAEGIRRALGKKESGLKLEGTVASGFREGKYYVSLPQYQRQFREKLGFAPYAGTLNVRLSARDAAKAAQIRRGEGTPISGFDESGREFGAAKCFECKIAGKIGGAIIVPYRTHYGEDVLEIIAPMSLRKKLGLKDGSKVAVEIS